MPQSITYCKRKTIIKKSRTNKSRTGGRDEIQIIAANIDVAFITESIGRDFNLNRFERYFAIAKDGGVKPVIILNKIDLISNEQLCSKLTEIKNRFNEVEIVPASSVNEEGLGELKNYTPSKVGTIVPGAASQYAGTQSPGRRPPGIILGGAGIGIPGGVIPIPAPFPHVAGHGDQSRSARSSPPGWCPARSGPR